MEHTNSSYSKIFFKVKRYNEDETETKQRMKLEEKSVLEWVSI